MVKQDLSDSGFLIEPKALLSSPTMLLAELPHSADNCLQFRPHLFVRPTRAIQVDDSLIVWTRILAPGVQENMCFSEAKADPAAALLTAAGKSVLWAVKAHFVCVGLGPA